MHCTSAADMEYIFINDQPIGLWSGRWDIGLGIITLLWWRYDMYCDTHCYICFVIQCSKHIAHHMSAAESGESMIISFHQSWK
jgi:hypothetical protein